MSNEDTFNPNGWHAPFCAYFTIPNLGLISDTNVEFRAVATDQSCNVDPNPLVVRFMIGETHAPETDVVWAKRADGTEFDVWPVISDSTDVTQLGPIDIAEPVRIMTTGEDATAITQVDLKYRKVGACYDLPEWLNPWRSMSADGYTLLRTRYDYPFDVDLAALAAEQGYGVYEFYPEAKDNEGNVTPPPVNPYRFKIMTNEATITTTLPDSAAPGDEFWFEAALATADPMAVVTFWYAERVLDVAIDAARITPDPDQPLFETLPLDLAMVDPGNNAVLTIMRGETPITTKFIATAAELIASGVEGDWTYDATGQAIEFKVAPLPTDMVTISYNVTAYAYLWTDGPLHSTDDDAPYTAAWDQMHGGVPEPHFDEVSAYDVIATVSIGSDECGLTEGLASEGKLVMLVDENAPDVEIYGRGLWNVNPGIYWPGNPSFDTVAGLTEWKLSGIEHEWFVTAGEGTPDQDPDDVQSVDLVFTGAYTGATETRIAMTKITGETVPMTFTLYESDFPDVRYGFENVGLQIDGFIHPMTETQPGVWQVTGVPIETDTETQYAFAIDQDGNDWDDYIPDPRNQRDEDKGKGGPGQPMIISSVNVPPTPFWFAPGPGLGSVTAVWKVRAEATDLSQNTGKTPDILFVYDPVAPTIDEVTSTSLRFNEDEEVTVNAIITDPVPADFNVITVKQARFQYSPNYAVQTEGTAYGRVWIDLGIDTDSDGRLGDRRADPGSRARRLRQRRRRALGRAGRGDLRPWRSVCWPWTTVTTTARR